MYIWATMYDLKWISQVTEKVTFIMEYLVGFFSSMTDKGFSATIINH